MDINDLTIGDFRRARAGPDPSQAWLQNLGHKCILSYVL